MGKCGGCRGLGSHGRHCTLNPAFDRRKLWADQAEDLADKIGPNNHEAANLCYAAAGILRRAVRGEATD